MYHLKKAAYKIVTFGRSTGDDVLWRSSDICFSKPKTKRHADDGHEVKNGSC